MVALRLGVGSLGGDTASVACAILRGEPAVGPLAGALGGSMQQVSVQATVQEARVVAPDGVGAVPAGADGLLAAVGAVDALVLRHDGAGTWRHAAGAGAGVPGPRGGAVQLASGSEGPLARAVRTGAVVRVLSGAPTEVVAGYRATTAAVVAVEADVAVVIGAPRRSDRLLAADDHTLRTTARSLLPLLDGEAPASPAAGATVSRALTVTASTEGGTPVGTAPVDGQVVDELRALHAVQELTGALRRPPAEAVERVARVLQEALGCQLAAVWLDDGPASVVRQEARNGSLLVPGDDEAVLRAARAAGAAIVAGPSPAPPPGAPLRPQDGVAACLVLPLSGPERPGGPAGGVLAVRSGRSAQPFSPLRRRIATQLVHTASTVLAVVLAREKIEQQLSDTRLQLGRDALTEVGSRHHWDSELAAAQGLVDAGVPVAVALLDLDDLKHVNDTYGHAAGDELLRTCGSALRACLRGSSDVVARVGGDEFAVLVPRVGDVEALVSRLRAGVEAARTADGLPLRVSVGAARAESGRTVAEAVTAADAAMYQDKRRRRALRAGAAEQPRA